MVDVGGYLQPPHHEDPSERVSFELNGSNFVHNRLFQLTYLDFICFLFVEIHTFLSDCVFLIWLFFSSLNPTPHPHTHTYTHTHTHTHTYFSKFWKFFKMKHFGKIIEHFFIHLKIPWEMLWLSVWNSI